MTVATHTVSAASFHPFISEMVNVLSSFPENTWNGLWARKPQRPSKRKDTTPIMVNSIRVPIKMLATLRRRKNWPRVLLLASSSVVCSSCWLHLLSVFSWSGRRTGTKQLLARLLIDTVASRSHQTVKCRNRPTDRLADRHRGLRKECDY